MEKEIVNRVAQSSLISFNLEDYYPQGERVFFDIKNLLWQELALKEQEFREFVKTNDWSVYTDKYVAISCTTDAIVPTWAYMLLAAALQNHAKKVVFGDLATLENILFHEIIEALNPEEFKDKRLVIKGCSKLSIPDSAYVALTVKLKPYVKSLMFGEACSSVPLYKKV
jgi:hypothetical protein